MKWSDNDDNWRDYAEAHPAQAERIRAISRRDAEPEPEIGSRPYDPGYMFSCDAAKQYHEDAVFRAVVDEERAHQRRRRHPAQAPAKEPKP